MKDFLLSLVLITSLPGLAAAQPCPVGDLDGNCQVNFNDVQLFAEQWLAAGNCPGVGCADLDGIASVNMIDLALLAGNWLKTGWGIVINEFMASNAATISDPQDPEDFPDWIELYNASSVRVDLGGMHLTDDLRDPTRWPIPDGITIEPNEFVVFWADGDWNNGEGDYHTNFELAAGAEEIGLFDSNGTTLIDGIEFDGQITDVSFGRYPDGSDNWRFFYTPTPWEDNDGNYAGAVADTKFSHDRGFYDQPFDLVITSDTEDAQIVYTTDGSEPAFRHGTIYTGPIHISSTTCIRAIGFKEGWMSTNVDTQTYIFGANSALKALPTLSIVMKHSDFIDIHQGGKPEFPTSVELLYSDEFLQAHQGDWEGFQIDCGIERHSSTSYRLLFKIEFGPARLNYPFFEASPVNADSAVDRFDRIVVRRGKNLPTTWAADAWVANAQVAMSGIGPHSMYMHMYVNGYYYDLINPKERPDAWFTSAYFGGEKDDYFATNHGIERCGGDRPNSSCHLSGDNTRFGQMYNMAGQQNLGNPSNYEQFKSLCDVAEFADYTILFWYSGFGDGIDNNWYAGMRNIPLNSEVPPEGFMMFMWDAEASFQPAFTGPPGNDTPWVPYYYDNGEQVIPTLWRALRENNDFMMLFADRIYKHLFNDGALTDDNSQQRWNAIVSSFIAGGYPPYEDLNMSGFVGIFIDALRDWGGLYPDIDPPQFEHGGQVDPGYSLTMSSPHMIYYTLDGSDPREGGGGVSRSALNYGSTGPITLNESTIVKARAKSGGEWSALHEATFAVGSVKENLRITEIMYHPGDPEPASPYEDDDFEFVELRNISSANSINLALVSFTNGVDFTFPSMSLAPGDYVVVVKNQAAFESRYAGGVYTAGEYTGRLENAGERIEIQDALGETILNFRYRDGWYDITDGIGFSLTVRDAVSTDPNAWDEKASWRPSASVGGSPGSDDTGEVPELGSVKINELLAHSHLATPDWIELHNTTNDPINIGGWFLSDSDNDFTKYEIAEGTTIDTDPNGYVVFYQDQHFGNPSDPGCHTPFALSENGETLYLHSGRDGVLTGYSEEEDFGASETAVAFGRYRKSTGTYNFVAMSENTPGAPNAYPKVGPVVISEIMYHPQVNRDAEYVELLNISGGPVPLYDSTTNEPWKFADEGGIEFFFPTDTPVTMADGERILLVKDLGVFSSEFTAEEGTRIFEWGLASGRLNNGGEKIQLSKPGDVDGMGVRQYIRVDRVNYSDGFHPPGEDPWPTEADGNGKSLTRKVMADYGNDVANWQAADSSPGTANP